MESDEALMVQLQGGDETALAILMDRWKAPLYAFLTRRIGPDAADDLFQESWIRIVRARDRFDPNRRFSTWMFQIANNLCRDLGRRRAVQRRAQDETRGQALMREPVLQPETAERDHMLGKLDALPGRQREVLVLRYYHDLSERDIAEVLGIPRGTVKSRMHAAMKGLREEFAEQPDTPEAASEETLDGTA